VPLDGVSISPLPLPEGWKLSECVDDTVDADGLSIRRVGLCATSEHGQAIGSAADVLEDPTPRARFELLERIAIAEAVRPSSEKFFRVRSSTGEEAGTARFEDVFRPSDAPDRWAFARSNGVSLNVGWSQACSGAARELVERDRVMRAWLGETVPVPLGDDAGSSILSGARSYEWRTYVFPPPEAPAIGGDLEVVGVFGFPRVEGRPLVSGYGARADRAEAVLTAQKEALQLLAFLWGEPLPDRAPDPLPAPMTHLETYQMRERHPVLRRWLDEGHAAHHRPSLVADANADRFLRFADLTPPWREGHLHVARALCPAAIPLIFGLSPLLAHLPSELRIHPIA
jgi:ribosomal protein S12 methylthiotransferase accessory factor YcaO